MPFRENDDCLFRPEKGMLLNGTELWLVQLSVAYFSWNNKNRTPNTEISREKKDNYLRVIWRRRSSKGKMWHDFVAGKYGSPFSAYCFNHSLICTEIDFQYNFFRLDKNPLSVMSVCFVALFSILHDLQFWSVSSREFRCQISVQQKCFTFEPAQFNFNRKIESVDAIHKMLRPNSHH